MALCRAAEAIDGLKLDGDEAIGADIVRRALTMPLKQIAWNAGLDGAVVLEKIKTMKPTEGYDALADRYCDLVEAGIIDPTKVVRSAVENAASVAMMILTAEALVTDIPEKEKTGPGPEMEY